MASGRLYLRNPGVLIVGAGARAIAVGRGAPVLLPIEGAALSALLARAIAPVSAAALGANAKTLASLVDAGVLLANDSAEALLRARGPAPADLVGQKPCKHLVLGVTGAINAVHTFAIASYLADYVCDRLDVVLTEAAQRIVRPDAYRYLGFDVWTDAFETRGETNVPHVALAGAELVAILPASASTIDKLARGACSDLLSLVVAATKAPVVVGPSMNATMWAHEAIADNVATLRRRGFYVLEPAMGTEVSAKHEARWELGAMPIEPAAIARALLAVLAAATAPRPTPRARRARAKR
ncbi:MAG TPA: flavoprotein [Kofleriaceae bacterium]|nr:flavoprotein [Kofleriaceae bacterium]